MQTLATVSKSTKQGLSVWRFVVTDNGEYFAFGGVKPACKAFATIDQLRSCYKSWVRYGYEPGLTPTKKALPRPEKPAWDTPSQLPEDLAADLWALEPSVAA
jgi:hypothetical protein